MAPSRRFARGLFIVLLVAACAALAIAPVLRSARAAPQASAISPDVVISEFRFIGPGGENDEFIELFNRSCSAVNVGDWAILYKNGQITPANDTLFQFPPGFSLDPGQYYLIGGPGYSGSSAANATYTKDVSSANGGIALIKPGVADPVDQVGVNLDSYHEGTPLDPLTAATDQGYRRNTVPAGQYVDINNNKQDFNSVSPSGPHSFPTSDVAACGIPTVAISGNTGGVANVILSYTDVTAKTVTSDPAGAYTITIPANWSGVIVPSKAGYTFSPVGRTYANVLADQTAQDYTASLSTPTGTPQPGYLSVLINEVGWMGTQAYSSDQWIELYNPNPYAIDLTDWELTGYSGSIGTGGVLTLSGTIDANCFLVIEKRSDVFQSLPSDQCNVKTLVDANLALSTYGESLSLYSNVFLLIDQANGRGSIWPAGTNTSSTNRRSMERHARSADIPANWFTFQGSPRVIVRDRANNIVLGTPGQQNWAFSVTATPSPVPTKYKTPTSPPPTPFGHMVINEFLPRAGTDWNQDGTVDVYDEFIEVKNLGPINGNLQGWKLDSISSAGTISFILPSQTLKPGDRAVFYRKTTNISLPDSGGTVRLTNTRGIIIDARGYGPVANPDQSTCRIPDGYYWRFPCFPTPGLQNSLTGVAPIPPPVELAPPPPCLMADIVPAPFRDAECYGYGGNMYSAAYWDDQSGFEEIPVQDALNKNLAVVK